MKRNRTRSRIGAWALGLGAFGLLTTLVGVDGFRSVALGAEEPPLKRVGTIALKGPVGGLDHMAIDAKRQRLLIANTSNGSLDIVDLKAGSLLRQIPEQPRIRGVDYSPELDRVFVGCGTGGICNVFDGDDYRRLRSLPLGDDADNVRYHPRTGRIYVVHAGHELVVIDAETYQIGSPIALPETLGAFKVESSRPRMYVNAKAAGLVVAIDAKAGQVAGRFPVSPANINASLAIDEANHRLFVGCREEPAVVVMDSDTGAIVARQPIPGGIDDLWYDAPRKRLYASCGAGEGAIAAIQQDDADHYRSLGTVSTASRARTSLFDSESNRLYLGVPRLADRPDQAAPEIWVYEARP
jgi:hypothetical protein